MFVIWVFVVQCTIRLVLIPYAYGMGRLSVIIHALTIFVVAGCGGWAIAGVKGRRLLQAVIALVLSTAWFSFSAFDLSAILSANLWNKPIRLDDMADIYCESRDWNHCLTDYPLLTGSALLVIFAGALVLFICADALAGRFAGFMDWIGIKAGRRLRQSFTPVLGASCAVYALAWYGATDTMLHREPVGWTFGFTKFESGPVELLIKPRPDFVIPPTAGAKPVTLVVITVDALRADHVELRPGRKTLTPFLQALATTGKLADLGPANSICAESFCGIVAIQSSSSWASMQNGPPVMLGDVLAANGYGVYFLLSGAHRTQANMKRLYGPHVTTMLDDLSPDVRGIADDRMEISRLQALQVADPARSYINIHLMSAHPGGVRFDRSRPGVIKRWVSWTERNDYAQFYSDGVRQADWIIQELFKALRRKGLLSNAIVVITADHGERLGRPNEPSHTGPPDPATVRIPLLVYQSHPTAFPAHDLVSQMDIAPTLIDLAGIEAPGSWQGRSLLLPFSRNVLPADYADTAGMVAYSRGKAWMIRCKIGTGNTELLPIPGHDMTPEEQRRALADAPSLYAQLPQRNDAAPCFRPAS